MIYVSDSFLHWDVLDSISNTDLVQKIAAVSASPGRRLLIVSNFSAFLQTEGKFAEAEPQLEELFRHSSRVRTDGDSSVVVWIESQMNQVVKEGGLFHRIAKSLTKKRWRWLPGQRNPVTSMAPVFTTKCRYQSPLSAAQPEAHLAIMKLELVGSA
jgi:hypothetical protein